MNNPYKRTKRLIDREYKSRQLIDKYYPGRIPVIVQKYESKTSYELPDIIKNQFLVPGEFTMNNLLYLLRSKFIEKLNPATAIYLIAGNKYFPSGNEIILSVYDEHKDREDEYLYIYYCGENTFGSD